MPIPLIGSIISEQLIFLVLYTKIYHDGRRAARSKDSEGAAFQFCDTPAVSNWNDFAERLFNKQN